MIIEQASGVMVRALSVSAVLLVVACGESPTDSELQAHEVAAKRKVSPAEAELIDLQLVAKAKGWTLDQARRDRQAADAVGKAATELASRRPDIFVGSVVADQPGDPPTLLVKGAADAMVRGVVAEAASAAGINIRIADNQPYSFDELEERKLRVHRALEKMGFRDIATQVGIQNGDAPVRAFVSRQAGLPQAAADLAQRLPDDVRGMADVRVIDPVAEPDQSLFGGQTVRDDGVSECTAGWSVGHFPTGLPGVTTAGHCSGINEIDHVGHLIHDLVFQLEHRGEWGDVEWHRPDGLISQTMVLAEFRAGPNDYRDVTAVEPRASISVGETICHYAPPPWQNVRNCSAEVQDASISCTNSGVFNDRLVQMNAGITIGGESGSGWSYNNRAYGGHKGFCGGSFSTFSVAALFDEALSVYLLVQ